MSFAAYPIKVYPIFKEKIWGGRKLNGFFELPDSHKIGEVWFFADQELDCSIISNGRYKGLKLNELMKRHSKEILGNEIARKYKGRFPLLFKYIDSEDRLSIQVHPDDNFAKKHSLPSGKSEAWYVLYSGKEAFIYLGLKKNAGRNTLLNHINNGRIINLLNKLKTKTGDGYYIPAGTVHSIGPSNIIFEIQQNTNVTYRIFDWERQNLEIPRELNLKDGISAIKTKNKPRLSPKIYYTKENGIKTRNLFNNEYFFTKELIVAKSEKYWYNQKSSAVLAVFEGCADVMGNFGKLRLQKGEVVLLPNMVNKFSIFACKRLKCIISEIK
jgi:mannose-6-phosphate isomerase